MEDLYKTLQTIKQHPTVRLGKYSIFHLEAFLFGYYYVMRHLEVPDYIEHQKEFDNLIRWIRDKYHVGKPRSWSSIILFYSEDERDALDNFFELSDEFFAQKSNLENQDVDKKNKGNKND